MKKILLLLLLVATQPIWANDYTWDDYWHRQVDSQGVDYLICDGQTYSDSPEITIYYFQLFRENRVVVTKTDHLLSTQDFRSKLELKGELCKGGIK